MKTPSSTQYQNLPSDDTDFEPYQATEHDNPPPPMPSAFEGEEEPKRRGRPPKGDRAMTNAERQANRRKRDRDQPETVPGDEDEPLTTKDLVEIVRSHQDRLRRVLDDHVYVSDSNGYWHPVGTVGGKNALASMLPERALGTAIETIAHTLQLDPIGIEEIELHELNSTPALTVVNRQAVLPATGRVVGPNELRPLLCTKRGRRGRYEAAYEPTPEGDEQLGVLSEQFGSLFVFRLLWRTFRYPGRKNIPIVYGKQSSSGKTAAAALLQEAVGDATFVKHSSMHGVAYDLLDTEMATNSVCFLDEADKVKLTPTILNNATRVGSALINPKYEPPRQAELRASFVLLAGGPLQLDWTAQGLLPNPDTGRGGRFRSACILRNDGIDDDYGDFLCHKARSAERRTLLNALVHYLIQTPWDAADAEQAAADLDEVIHAQPDAEPVEVQPWQQAILDAVHEDPDGMLELVELKAIVESAGHQLPGGSGSGQVDLFMRHEYGVASVIIRRRVTFPGLAKRG